jgi:elongation of very long chain fatty acids protein 4
MYSYYALALMKVRCPWKRYLTQAQLLQFTSVVIYTIATAYLHYHHGSPEAIEGVQPSLGTYYFCCVVQVFEMVSLFVLFSLFYKRKYSSSMNDDGGGGGSRREQRSNDADRSTSSSSSSARAAESSSSSEDQCYRAMGEISEAAKEVAGHAAKDAGKVVAAATKAVTRGNGKGRVGANVM